MVRYFILSHSQWWHCYYKLLYTFRQSMVALLWSASSTTSWAAQIPQHCMMLLVCQFIYLFNSFSFKIICLKLGTCSIQLMVYLTTLSLIQATQNIKWQKDWWIEMEIYMNQIQKFIILTLDLGLTYILQLQT